MISALGYIYKAHIQAQLKRKKRIEMGRKEVEGRETSSRKKDSGAYLPLHTMKHCANYLAKTKAAPGKVNV